MAMIGLRYDLRAPDWGPASLAELYAACLDQCRWADERGFDTVVLSEHHGAEDSYLRFLRELKRFERTWSVSASVGAPVINPQEMEWNITSRGPNWQVENQFHLVRWDDIIQSGSRAPLWRRLPFGLLAFLDFVLGLAKDDLSLRGRGGIVHVQAGPLGALQGLQRTGDQMFAGLGQNLNRDVIGN